MRIHKIVQKRAIISSSVIILLSALLLAVLLNFFSHVRDEITSGTEWFTKDAVRNMHSVTLQQLKINNLPDSLLNRGFIPNYFKLRLNAAYFNILSSYKDLEGGFYFLADSSFIIHNHSKRLPGEKYLLNEFPEIIRKEIESSLKSNQTLHSVIDTKDAIFHLSVSPVSYKGTVTGAVWCTMRIDQMLPVGKFNYLLAFLGIISVGGVVVSLIVSTILRLRVEEVQLGLKQQRLDPDFRLRKRKGILGSIVNSINETADERSVNEKEKEKLALELRQKEKLAALGKLLAGVAHEIKTPLAIMKTRIQMWQRKLKDPSENGIVITPESMELIVNEIDRLADLVKKLLVFSKAKNKNLMSVDLPLVINQVEDLLQQKFQDAGAAFTVSCPDNFPKVLADSQGLEQVFINLFSNSIEAMPNGGTLSVTAGRSATLDGFIELRIRDTGNGIPDADKEMIFDPFFTTRDQGTGLGLSIAFEVISACHGKIYLNNDVSNGAEFVIELKEFGNDQ